ncbi:hypothetical protein A6A06_09635 [Streptomyces sp. CB02923]|uniref:hypothetical protein n=1 Tax=Streptomyces sp. CB02923 TaxID=1718985 RepID=UPI00093DF386|nr:hypothetical protein [Streptomyces sp. CB02923]OKI04944.1 hypothetical protein A6A06_09635 [Streptomyces sp. CB02923]
MPTDPAREIVRAVDRLTTQVRRLADHLTTPVTDEPTTASAAPRQPNAARTGRSTHGEQHYRIGDDGAACRDALLVLLSRAARGVLTPDEGPLLRQHVEHLLHDRDQLAAAVDRVRAVADGDMELQDYVEREALHDALATP